MRKQFLEEQAVLLDAFRLGASIFKSGFRPSFIVGIWRGGSSVAIYVQECLQALGIATDHIAIRTSYRGAANYQDMVSRPQTNVRVHGTEYLLENLNVEDRLLIVDDVISTGYNLCAVLEHLQTHLRRNLPHDIRVATLYQRPDSDKTGLKPDYCLHQTDHWLVFPYEMSGLTSEQILAHKPWLARLDIS